MTTDPKEHLLVYGSTASYYTGKLEAYFRAKGIAYRLVPFCESNMRRCARHTGVVQIPQVECPDGSWLVDTTLIIEHFECVRPDPAVAPRSPAVLFVSALLEDYADEWLWRPAMHYRWSFPETAHVMSAWLAEHLDARRGPQWMKRLFWRQRQYRTFVKGDGVNRETRAAVEGFYLETLAVLESIFHSRPFVLGERPTEADFGFFASMFRHFACDPAPGRIMRQRAPGVHEWVARMWNLRPEAIAPRPMPERIPADLGPLLGAVTGIYLPYLEANAAAYAAGKKRVRYHAAGADFVEPVKPYRVWCRERLRAAFAALDDVSRAEVERALGAGDAAAKLSVAAPKPVASAVASLPIRGDRRGRSVDSWWR